MDLDGQGISTGRPYKYPCGRGISEEGPLLSLSNETALQSSSFPCGFSLHCLFLPRLAVITYKQNSEWVGYCLLFFTACISQDIDLRDCWMLRIVEFLSLSKRKLVILQVCSFVLVSNAPFVKCGVWSVQQIHI